MVCLSPGCNGSGMEYVGSNKDGDMKKLLVLGASSSRESINRVFARFAAEQVSGVHLVEVDLSQLNLPLFSVDLERSDGIPPEARDFYATIAGCDALVVSLAEHNGSYTAAFKNLFDWTSRHESKVWADKPMLLLSTSPGGRGGASVMAAALQTFPHLGGKIIAHFSLPSFGDNFQPGQGITDPALKEAFDAQVALFQAAVSA